MSTRLRASGIFQAAKLGDFADNEAVARRLSTLLEIMRSERQREAKIERDGRLARGESPFPLITFRDIAIDMPERELRNSDTILERIQEIGLWLGAERMIEVARAVERNEGVRYLNILDHAWDGIHDWVA